MKQKLVTLLPFIKEPLRLLLLGLVSFALVEVTSLPQSEGYVVLLTLFLRFADKWLHDIGKELEKDNLTKSITRF